MEEDDQDFGATLWAQPPQTSRARRVSLTPFSPSISPSSRRLSSHFSRPNQPVRAARQLSLVSLQGRFAGAEEATSARNVGSGLGPEEGVAWELFSPIHRILIVAVVAVAASKSKKNKEIFQLRKSVELRDQVLLSMQQKLDSLCEQVNYSRDQPQAWVDMSVGRNADFLFKESYGFEKAESADYCHGTLNPGLPPTNDAMDNLLVRTSCGDEMVKYKMDYSYEAEQEERRMSDMSDWASSVTSAADIQFNSLSMEQDIYNLKKECMEKDAKIDELNNLLYSIEAAHRKRVAELEDIIRCKNTRIAKLKKDMLVLEQKVMNLTRLRRPSFCASVTNNTRQLPVMQDNLVYDMESTTSPSSSDSDRSPKNQKQCASVVEQVELTVQSSNLSSSRMKTIMDKPEEAETPISLVNPATYRFRPTSPASEKPTYQKLDVPRSVRRAQSLSAGGDSKNRRRPQTVHKAASTSQKRWV